MIVSVKYRWQGGGGPGRWYRSGAASRVYNVWCQQRVVKEPWDGFRVWRRRGERGGGVDGSGLWRRVGMPWGGVA